MTNGNAPIAGASGRTGQPVGAAEVQRRSTKAPLASTMIDRWALARVQQLVKPAPIRFVLWDGFELAPDGASVVATIVVKRRHALFGWVFNPELNFGEAYMSGAVEISGDLVRLLEEIYRARARDSPERRSGRSPRPRWCPIPKSGRAAIGPRSHRR